MKQLIFFLSFFYFYCVIAMEKLHPDTIALIICQPNYSFLNHMNIEGSDVASKSEKENSKQKIKNSCDIFMPGFKLLLTCKGYYNNAFKEKIKSFLTTRYIPQGTCLYFLPKSMHQEILQNNTYLETKKLFEALTNLCVQEQPITLDSIQKIVNLDIIVSEKLKCIVYKGWILREKGFFKPYTFIEYLYEESRLKVTRMERRTNMFYIKTLKNIFFLIEYLYQKKIIDLELPISGNGIRNFR